MIHAAAACDCVASKAARRNLTGVHNLVHSASTGSSSGRLPFCQGDRPCSDNDDDTFINWVELGPLKIVTFQETTVSLFGQRLAYKNRKWVEEEECGILFSWE